MMEIELNIDDKSYTKAKNEALLTAGMGYGNKKKADLEAFWSLVVPGLLNAGWEVVSGEGEKEGTTTFIPPNVDTRKAKRNIDYYDRIKILMERIEERRNSDEAKLADLYREQTKSRQRMQLSRDPLERPRRGPGRPPKLGVSYHPRDGEEVDTSWKDGGATYPKRSSQVGDEYQVSSIPPAGTYLNTLGTAEASYEIIWDNNQANSTGVTDFLDKQAPFSKRGRALEAFHNNQYSLENAPQIMDTVRPTDCSDWTAEEKETFRNEIFRKRKDFKELGELLHKDMGDILSYYLGTYKKSDEYRLLKTVLMEEKIEKARSSLHHVDQCAICEDGGSLLICDGCESEWHMTCTRPILKDVPEGRWECDLCVDQKFLEGWKRSVRSINGKRKLDSTVENSTAPYDKDPRLQIAEAIKIFSSKLDSVFHPLSSTKAKSDAMQLT